MNWDWDKLKEQQQKRSEVPRQLDELFKKVQFNLPGGPFIILIILAVIFLGSSMFYTVDVDEVGIVQRFGKYLKETQPGLNFKLPTGIDKVTKVKVRRVYKEEFGFVSYDAGSKQSFSMENESTVSIMLTGDLNVALVPWVVQYKIDNARNYLFKVHNVKGLLRDMSEASMRLIVGDRSINEIITRREEIAEATKVVLQKVLDDAETGIKIETVELKRTNVPEPVQPSFNEVNQAVQEKEKMIYQAQEEYNKAIPAAKGEAERMIRSAEGYALERINRAKGDAARFMALYEEYSKAKDVTKRRLYLETIRDIYPKIGQKYIVDSNQKNVLPFLNLGNPVSMPK